MQVLGISAFYHDSAACLVRDGQIVAAAEEERLSRLKHDNGFPFGAIRYVLHEAKCSGADLDAVVFYEKPLTKVERTLQIARAYADQSQDFLKAHLRHYMQTSLQLPSYLEEACGFKGNILYCDHHLSHAASTFFSSPFEEAAILTVDGVGEWTTTSLYQGKGKEITPLRSIAYPHSLGLFYAALTAYLGFEVNEGEYKVMGLAPYGKPTQMDKLRKLITLHEDGSFALDLSYFTFMHDDAQMYGPKMIELLGPDRKPGGPMEERHRDIAASAQKMIEEALLNLVSAARRITGCPNLCLAGGVGHNVVANTRIKQSGAFDGLYIHFACGDSGGAIGAALYGYHRLASDAPRKLGRATPYLGPSFSDEEMFQTIERRGCRYEKLEREELVSRVAELIADEFVIGWFQGRMEYGPRALGHRSILASPRRPEMKDIINARVKRREEFRPFAPAVLEDKAADYFVFDGESPAMLFAAPVVEDKRSVIPAVTHVDGSARAQTVRREDNPLYYDLIKAFEAETGVPVIINTSFNIRGEPIVCTPDDAINCFLGTDIDFLVLGSYLISK